MSKNTSWSPSSRYRSKGNQEQNFQAVSVSTKDFRWLHSEVWDRHLTEYFAANLPQLPLLIFAAPPFTRPHQNRLKILGRWILLKTNSDAPVSWVEAQIITGSFLEIWLFVGPRIGAGWAEDGAHITELGLLISAIFISAKPDVINFTFTGANDRAKCPAILGPESGELRQILTPLHRGFAMALTPDGSPTRYIETKKFSRNEWENTQFWKSNKETLAYLVKRTEGHSPIRKEKPFAGAYKLLAFIRKLINPFGSKRHR